MEPGAEAPQSCFSVRSRSIPSASLLGLIRPNTSPTMSGSGKGLLGLWLYRSGEKEWALKEGSPIHHSNSVVRDLLESGPVWITIKSVIMCFKVTSAVVADKTPPPLGRGTKVENLNLSFAVPPSGPVDRTSIMFTLKNQVGCLARALQVFQELGINVLHLDLQNTDPNKVTGIPEKGEKKGKVTIFFIS